MSVPVLALSIRQPWAWLILNAGKDVENRKWATKVRGRVLIHAAKGMTRLEHQIAVASCRAAFTPDFWIPPFDDLQRGGIVGEVEIVDCVTASRSPWFCGPHGFVLRNPKPLPFQTCKGRLGFFTPEGLR